MDNFEVLLEKEEILTVAIMKGKYSLTQKLIDKYKIPFNIAFVNTALEYNRTDIVFLLRIIYPQSFARHEKSYISSLILSFERSNINWLAKMHLLKTMIEHISYIKSEQVWIHIVKSIESENPLINPLYFTPNVLLFSCNLIELCILLRNKFSFLSSYSERIQAHVSKFAGIFIEKIDDDETLRSLVFEKDFESRDSLDLLSYYNIVDIMNNKNMDKIALELWSSQYDIKGNLMSTSSVYKIVMGNNFIKPWDVLGDYSFTNWQSRRIDNFEHHLFQFKVWKKSMFSKFVFEGLFLTIFTILFQYYLIKAISAANTVNSAFSSYSNASSSNQTSLYKSFQVYSAEYKCLIYKIKRNCE